MVKEIITRERAINEAISGYSKLFVSYDNPKKAMLVWFEYLRDLYEAKLLGSAQDIVRETRISGELDTRLSKLLEEAHFKLIAVSSNGDIFNDGDFEGGEMKGYSIVKRTIDDSV